MTDIERPELDAAGTAGDAGPPPAADRTEGMSAVHVKRLFAVVGSVAAVVLLVAALLSLADVVRRQSTGADPAAALNLVPPVPEDIGALVTWEPDAPDLARLVEPTTREQLEAAWVRGWHRLDAVWRTGDITNVDVWFRGAITDRIAEQAEAGSRGSVTQHGHALRIDFYSLDGSIVGLSATSELTRTTGELAPTTTTERHHAVLVLSDGNWRIQQMVSSADNDAQR